VYEIPTTTNRSAPGVVNVKFLEPVVHPYAFVLGNPASCDRDTGGTTGTGVTVSAAVRFTPPYDAVMVADVVAATALVVTAKVALVDPAATSTVAGTVADPLSLVSPTVIPPAGAAPLKVTAPVDAVPPTTVVGLTAADANEAGTGPLAAALISTAAIAQERGATGAVSPME
jgi:hypothetical protein